MKISTKFFLLLMSIGGLIHSNSVNGQSILNPTDTLATYDSTRPPAQPPFGQIGKWVRSYKRVNWNTSAYKAYIYKGVAFRLRFPKSYNPALNDGKKYPMLVFFHGLGEAAPITDNEDQLFWGAEYFGQSVDNGTFDGYVLFMQSQGFWGGGHYDYIKEIIDYMVVNNKLDPFSVVANGLSAGGQATWEMFLKYPTYINSAMPMDAVSIWYKDTATVNKVKNTPFWITHGALDGSPAPSTAEQVRDAMLAAGGNYRNTMFANVAHFSWPNAWNEPDFWPFVKRAYASNPWPSGGRTEFCSSGPFSTVLGLAPGFDGYQWRKDNVVITGATDDTLKVTQPGTYQARVLRGGIWSEWSRIPVVIKTVSCSVAPPQPSIRIEGENVIGGYGLQFEPTKDILGGYSDVTWMDINDYMDYSVTLAAAGTYTVNFRVASLNTNARFQLVRASDSAVLATVAVPVTGGSQVFQTVSAQVTLPAGKQTLRIITIAPGWNFNWWEIVGVSGTTTNQPPTVSAGSAQTITLPTDSVKLAGSASDIDGSVASYQWTQISGPSPATFSNAASAQTTAGHLVGGSYVFQLKATDNGGASSTSQVTITVIDNNIPAVTSIRIEAEKYVAMSGIQTENTGDPGGGLDVGWQDNNDWMDYQVNLANAGTYTVNFRVATVNTGVQFQLRNASGTALATVTAPNTGWWQTYQTVSAVVNLPAGIQTLRIVTTDAKGSGWNINWWEIIAGGTVVNKPPTVNAGSDQTITLPVNTATLSGSANDSDGTIASYAWTQISGPNTATLSNATSASASASGVIAGTYVFRLTVKDNSGASASDDMSLIVNPAPPPPPGGGSTTRIEAENYVAMSGIQTEKTADPTGGGLNVGWQENNDWMDYFVNIPAAGTYTLNFRVATPNTGVQFQLRNATGTALTTVTVPNTGWWQTYQTISVQVALPAGQQTLRIVTTDAKGTGWNINWWEIVGGGALPPPPPVTSVRIEAENYTAMSGVQAETTADTGGGLDVGWQENNDWMDYSVNVGAAGVYKVNFRVATPNTGVQFQLRNSSGIALATVIAPNTGWWQTFQTVSATVTLPAGQQTLRIYTTDAKGTGWNINWWELILSTAAAQSIRTEASNQTLRSDVAALQFYPNPVASQVLLQVNNEYTGTMNVRVVNLAGAVQKQFRYTKANRGSTQNYIQLGDLPKGEYMIEVRVGSWTETRKLMKL